MRNTKAFLLMVSITAAAAAGARDADACGGCFTGETETTVVTGHKMILSVSQQQTTLYDQIVYSGSPSSFAWILPIKGLATVGLSSDALFQVLDQQTAVQVNPPFSTCPPVPDCFGGFGSAGAGGGSGADAGGPPVTVVAQTTVGPYETVQLKSSDPTALSSWLTQHGYNVPVGIQPVISAYVTEGFDFLALKLVPGQGVSAMRPVRITTPGATPVLPLRMVAAGTGMITPITLWILGEGRYEPVNLPAFQIDPAKLVWDWDTQSSNYSVIRQAGFTATNNKGWLIQASEPLSSYLLTNQLDNLTQYNPMASGYADAMGNGAQKAEMDDLAALFGGITPTSLVITRVEGELSRAALGADLQLGAASDQSQVKRFFQLVNSVGTPAPCQTFPPCPGTGGAGGTGGTGGTGGLTGTNRGDGSGTSFGGCAMTGGDEAPMLGGLALMAALAFARRRRPRADRRPRP